MPQVIVCKDQSEIANRAAKFITQRCQEALKVSGQAQVALAGGNTPKATYQQLPELISDWKDIELWFGDERAVTPESPESNYLMVQQALLQHIAIDAGQVHRIKGELEPAIAAASYAQELLAKLPANSNHIPTFDLITLGLGEDGHTASLFPNSPALKVRDQLCVAVNSAPKPPPERVTLTIPVLRAAKQQLFIVTGVEKATALKRVMAEPNPQFPASLVISDNALVIADEDACSSL